jgi:hypothetical protein
MIWLSTIIKETGNISGKCTSAVLEQISTGLHEVRRPLMTPDEVMQLPGAKKDAERRVERYWCLLREGGLFGGGRCCIFGIWLDRSVAYRLLCIVWDTSGNYLENRTAEWKYYESGCLSTTQKALPFRSGIRAYGTKE